ncbi:DNA primase family protein [Schleiferilactobacillus perolens]|uniref:DNA primase family protein n=1 Tax=Schleiferilactobacillus perolens TaxID=100468 RepID=UPI002355F40E|nr:phage/plasmid primase, P4 family [Schleiferilactobacillus perolens]MCI2170985.1 phage/plasmid primase, P4 family [Schleiferilactobacillus perolens]
MGTGSPAQDFEWLLKYQPDHLPREKADNVKQVNGYKKSQGRFFVAGKFSRLDRHNENLENRTVLVLDFDEIDSKNSFIKAIQRAFPGTTWYAYPSVSNGFPGKGVRYRLVVEIARPYPKEEHEALVFGVAKVIGYRVDNTVKAWARIMGLPVLNKYSTESDLIKHTGQPLDVDQFLTDHPYQKPKKFLMADTPGTEKYVANLTGETEADLPGENFVDGITATKMIEEWAGRHASQLQEEGFFTNNALFPLIRSQRKGEIDEATMQTAMDILALGNGDWETGNRKKLNAHRVTKLQKPKYSFTEYFGGAAEDFDSWPSEEAQPLTKEKLKRAVLKHYQRVLEFINKDAKTGQEKKGLSLAAIAKILYQHIPMWRTEDSDGALIYLYDPVKGIYDGDPLQIQRWVHLLAPNTSEPRVKEVAYFLQGYVGVQSLEDNPQLVPVGNGIYDYRTQKLLPFSPKYFFTAKTATNYVKNCKEPKILVSKSTGEVWQPSEFIKSLAVGNPQVVKLLFEVIADAANGNYSRGQAIFLVGSTVSTSENGSNGKGTFQDLVQAIVGDENTAHLKVDEMDKRFAIINLLGKSVNIGDDLQANVYIDNSSNFNSATTGDMLYSDVKNKKPVALRFKGAMIQSTNEMPRFKNQTGGTYRRMVLVPFNAHFSGENDNPEVKNDYIHRQDVREWFLAQALEMPFFKRFTTPEVSKQMLEGFKLDNDPIRQFVADELALDDRSLLRIGGTDDFDDGVYSQYVTWARNNGFNKPVSRPNFTAQLKGLLNETPVNKKTITPQEWKDLVEKRKTMHEVIPLAQAEFSYKQKKFGGKPEWVIEFETRAQIEEALKLAQTMPAESSTEYQKRADKLRRLQAEFIR